MGGGTVVNCLFNLQLFQKLLTGELGTTFVVDIILTPRSVGIVVVVWASGYFN